MKDNLILGDMHKFLAEINVAETSLETYTAYLWNFVKWVCESNIDFESIDLLNTKNWIKSNGWASSTQYQTAVVVKQFAIWRYGNNHPLSKLRIKRIDPGPQRTLNAAKAGKLIDSLSPDLYSEPRDKIRFARNQAMIVLMIDTGLRASEVCRLSLDYLNLDDHQARVLGKGNKWKMVVFSEETAEYLRSWLSSRAIITKPDIHNVFVGVQRSVGRPMTRHGLRAIFRKLGMAAGIGELSPHDLRRTMATLSIRNGAPTRLVQEQGGWSDIKLVQRYSQALSPEDFAPYSPISALRRAGITK